MPATFACPECGTPVTLPEHGAGRRARCEECLTLVEAPFLPRKSRRGRVSNARAWSWVAIAFACALIVATVIYWTVRERMRGEERRVFRELVANAALDEKQGDFDKAINRLNAALGMTQGSSAIGAAEAAPVAARRDELAARFKQIQYQQRLEQGRADMERAHALVSGDPNELKQVLDLCERAAEGLIDLQDPPAHEIASDARSLALRLIQARGLVFEKVGGSFVSPTENGELHASKLHPILRQALEAHGFLPKRDQSWMAYLWDKAPYRVSTRVHETYGRTYMESVLRTSRIDVDLALLRGDTDLWHNRVSGQTRVPSPRFTAQENGYLALIRKQDPELERRLYNDALVSATEQMPARIASLPDWSAVSNASKRPEYLDSPGIQAPK